MTCPRTSIGVAEACAQALLAVLERSPAGDDDRLLAHAERLGMRPQAARLGLDHAVAHGLVATDAHGVIIAVPRRSS